MIFFQILIQAKIKTENIKDMFIYLLKAVIQLVIGIVLYKVVGEVIVKMLELTGTLQNDYAQHTTIIDVIKSGKIKLWFAKVVVTAFVTNKLYINIFIGVEVAVFILSISDSRQNKNAAIFLATLGMILSNYIFTVLMENPMLRTNYAWALSMGLLSIYLYMLLKNMKYMSKIILVIFALITIYNTRSISNSFYQEYLGYEKDKNDAYRIAQEIYIQCKDVTKPICFTWEGRQINEDDKYIDGRISVFKWGLTAFDEKSTETIKFINSLGYNFLGATKEQLLEARDEYSQVREIIDKGQWVIELDNYIVVNLKFMQ